jgi:exopolysaccharide biosynthesis polyprenyl glycosylphosphotransferase
VRRTRVESAQRTLGAQHTLSATDVAQPIPLETRRGQPSPPSVSADQIAPPLPGTRRTPPRSRTVSAERIISPIPLVPPIPGGPPSEAITVPIEHDGIRPAETFPTWLRVVDQVHGSVPSVAAVVADALVAAAAGAAAGVGRAGVAILIGLVLVTFTAGGLYTRRTSLETQGVAWYPARVVGPLFAVVVILAAIVPPLTELRVAGLLAVGLVTLRALTWAIVVTARRRGRGLCRTMVIGGDAMSKTVVDKLAAFPEAGLVPVDVLHPATVDRQFGRLPDDLSRVVTEHRIRHVVLLPEGDHDGVVADCIERCDGLDLSFSMLPPLSELFLHPCLVTQVGGMPLIALGTVSRNVQSVPGKRLFDLVVGSALLLLAAPLMAATAVAIWLQDRGPILFQQQRVGQGGKTFPTLKFRSMVVDAEQLLPGLKDSNVTDGLLFKMERDPRVTPVGRVIRRYSIDELPQLLNVLKGQMSLVGPRPLAVHPDDFGTLDGKRHCVPPGITGYWQIAGSNGLTYDEMVKLDFAYINNWSVWLDARLLARTVPALFNRRSPA